MYSCAPSVKVSSQVVVGVCSEQLVKRLERSESNPNIGLRPGVEAREWT